MSMVDDYKTMDAELLARYEKVVKTKWEKLYILVRYMFFEIIFLAKMLPRTLFSGYFYYFGYKAAGSPCDIHKDVRYSSNRPRNVMDVYEAARKPQGNPVVVFIHGGAWGHGFKMQYILLGRRLALHGVTTIIANYTLYPPGRIEQQVEDVDELMSYLNDHVQSYGGRLDDITIMGHSAGAHILAQYLVTTHSKPTKSNKINIKNYIGLSGPFDISDHFIFESNRGVEHISPMRPCCNGPAGFKQASPAYQIVQRPDKSVDLPKMYFLHGNCDYTVPIESTIKFCKLVQQKSNCHTQILEYEQVQHIEIIFLLKDVENPSGKPFIHEYATHTKRDNQSILNDVLQIIYRSDNSNI